MDILPRRETAAGGLTERRMNMAEQPKLAEELKKMEYEPLLPVEKKLIGWSLGLGAVLLGILVWVSYTFFPTGH
jgi:hypothetical protein